MTSEEVRLFNLARRYAERKYRFLLTELRFDRTSGSRTLIFNDPEEPSQMTRQVTVFEDQFRETVAANELSPATTQNINDALGDKA